MSTSLTNTGVLALEVLFFNAGLRSLTFYPDCKTPQIRPDWLPKIELIGLDNDLILKGSDSVVDFACHAVSDSRLGIDRYYWLGIYIHSQDTVGDRSNFLGIGFWIPPGYIFNHQAILESLFWALTDVQEKLHLLISNDPPFLDVLEKFRGSAESLKLKSSLYQNLPIVGAGELERAYVKITTESNSQAEIAGAISTMLLKNSVQIAPRTLFLIGPDLPKLPRRGWKLYPSSVEYLAERYVTDFLLAKLGQDEVRSENDALKVCVRGLEKEIFKICKDKQNLSNELTLAKQSVALLNQNNDAKVERLEKKISDISNVGEHLSDLLKSVKQSIPQTFATSQQPGSVSARTSSSGEETTKRLDKIFQALAQISKTLPNNEKNTNNISSKLKEVVIQEFSDHASEFKKKLQNGTITALVILVIVIALSSTMTIYLSIKHWDTEKPSLKPISAQPQNYPTQPKIPPNPNN